MANYPFEIKDLMCPSNEDICKSLNEGLKVHFKEVSVSETDCPDLTQKPWTLAATGICGTPKVMDVGGVPYLVPSPQKDKVYKFDDLAVLSEDKNRFFIGAGAGPCHIVGCNAEMMANLKVGEKENIQTYVAKIDEKEQCALEQLSSKEFCLLGNFLSSEGKSGKVLRIKCKTRLGEQNFTQAIRKVLADKYSDEMIGIGGVFVIKTGKAKLHVMPNFCERPLESDEDVNNWLKFFEMSAPLVCLSVFYNIDKDMDLRVEHTHCFSHHGEGGHYHYDTTPDDVEYEGYFILAEQLIRVDRPKETHQVGRD